MGAKKKAGPRKKITPKKVSEVVAALASKDEDAVSRVRKIVSALDMEKTAGVLDASEEIMAAVGALLRRSEDRYTLAEAAEKAGVPVEQFAQLNLACGFPNPEPDARVFTDEDVNVLQLFQGTTELFGEEVAMQNVRVMGSAMSRVADAFLSSFAVSVGKMSREGNFDEDDLARANETAVALLPSAMQAMDVLLRRHMELKSRPVSELIGEGSEGLDAIDRAVGFCDLVGYTALSEQISAVELASVLRRFETTASDLITALGANVVKLIGDEVMFVAPDAARAADVALTLAWDLGKDDALPPVRCGVAAGRVIAREGDYHGPVVNLAARIVKLAPPGGVLLPASIVDQLSDGLTIQDAGSPELKGFEEPVALVRIRY